MGWFLPVPEPPPNEQGPASAQEWEQAAPTADHAPVLDNTEGRVTRYRTGPGDIPGARDAWMNPDIFVVPRAGVMNGRELFVGIPGPPPEGHGGYDPFNDPPKIDHSTRTLALYMSDWNGIVQQQQMRGEHVIIQRVPPGSTQGYMPTGMDQLNNQRDVPAPWDASLTAGG
jgi:hypothetical protein